jgi:hypothetical protein
VLERKSVYRWKVENAIWELAQTGAYFCADQVRAMVGDPPREISSNLTGALFHAAARSGLIRSVGYTHSARVVGHKNVVKSWVGNRG